MERLVELQISEAPEHKVLPQARQYDVRTIKLDWSEEKQDAELIIEASTYEKYAILQFKGVEELHIPCGDSMSSIPLIIQDTSKYPSTTHHIPPIRVGGAGDNRSSLSFWAQSVELIKE